MTSIQENLHAKFMCQLCVGRKQQASYCAVCRTCQKHSMHCQCSKQFEDHASIRSACDGGIGPLSGTSLSAVKDLNNSLLSSCNYYDINSINNDVINKTDFNDLFLIHVNIRSLQKNIDKLTQYILQLKKLPDVIAITETKLNKDLIYNNIDIDGYNFVHSDSTTNAGGVGFYVKNFLSFKIKLELGLKLNFVENIWIQVDTDKHPITIGVIYRHPVYIVNQLELFNKALDEIFLHLNMSKTEFYILGDFNIDLLQAHSNHTIRNYANTLISYSVKCTIDKPTRILTTRKHY